MRAVRFLKKTAIPGGPLYHPGEVVELKDEVATSVIRFGHGEYLEHSSLLDPEPGIVVDAPLEVSPRRPRK
jgi:hypothetical protein